jgi:hypothetical protein
MIHLTKSYEIETTNSIESIFHEIRRKQQYQDKNGSFWDLVDYRAFNLTINRIEIQRNPSMFNPFRGLGIIVFELKEHDGGTTVKYSIDPVSWRLYAMLLMLGLFLLMLTTLMLLNADGSYLSVAGGILFMWTFGLGMIYFSWRLNLFRLQNYAISILKDLNILYKHS